jgi:vitamin B12/bleomycin/antimicrobial peptide transport system ATP-binding/permease protein
MREWIASMMASTGQPTSRAEGPGIPSKDSLFTQLSRMSVTFWGARERNRLLLLALSVVVVLAGTAYAQIRLNAWNKPFYDALTRKDTPEVLHQLGVFALLAVILLVLNVAQMWLNLTSKVLLRQGLGHELLNEWLHPLRAFRLSHSGWMGVNPDQRLHADAQHLTDLTTDLGIGLLQAAMLLLSFIGVLWVLSRQMLLPIGGHEYLIPGYMVWWALIYAGTASLLSWWVGRPLVALDAERYAREADMRFALVRANEEIEGVTIFGGEAGEHQHINSVFDTVLEVSRRIVGATTRLTWVTAGYGWFTIVAPILVAAPSYLAGHMSFGELMMVVGAFNQVQSSLRWFVDNFSSLADWRATLLRVGSFRSAVMSMDRLGQRGGQIDLQESQDGTIEFDGLCVAAPNDAITLSEPHVLLQPGQRVLITGERASERTLLFQAIIGIWLWGRGVIRRPPREAVTFLPARAYLPPGSLRSAVCYPRSGDACPDAAVSRALAAVGLERLEPQLDTHDRWDRRLNDDERQCLAFARLLLQRPHWAVLNSAFDVLDPVSRKRIRQLLTNDLKEVGLICIGTDADYRGLTTRTLQLVTDPHGPVFSPVEQCADVLE